MKTIGTCLVCGGENRELESFHAGTSHGVCASCDFKVYAFSRLIKDMKQMTSTLLEMGWHGAADGVEKLALAYEKDAIKREMKCLDQTMGENSVY